MGEARLPDFLVVGAMRSGTTSLARWLGAHPEVFVSPRKEVHYFDLNYERGPGWYASHFADAGDAKAAGEATPVYMYRPEVPGRIAGLLPSARLVVVLRHPVDRAWSHYWLNREKRRERLSFEDALAAEPERLATAPTPWTWAYVDRGRYVEQLERLASLFPASQLHVLLFDDLANDPAGTFAAVTRFVAVDDGVVPPAVGRRANAYRRVRSGRVADLTRRWPSRLRDAVGRLNTRPAAYPTMAPETRERLLVEFAGPNAELARWLGRDLSGWSR
jgi:hypothetical protein